VAIGAGMFFSCEKENNKVNNNINKQKSLDIDFSAISVQNGMLCFDSWEHYQTVLESLAVACEDYANDYFTALENELGVEVDIETLNDTADERGFSQFAPLHDFCDSFNFSNLYEVLEAEELQWMNTENSTIETNPFYNTYFDRYQSALHNTNGDVKIGDSIFNPSDAIQKTICITAAYVPGGYPFTYNGNTKLLLCKVKGQRYQCFATTTFYKVKYKNGQEKRTLFCDMLSTSIAGEVGVDCDGLITECITSKSKTQKYVCHQEVHSWHDLIPAYLIDEVHSGHSAVNANQTIYLYL